MPFFGSRNEYIPGHNQSFFIGESDFLAGEQPLETWHQSGAADDRRQHYVDFRRRCHCRCAGLAEEYFRFTLAEKAAQPRYILFLLDRNALRREFFNLFGKECQILSGCHAGYLEPIRKLAHQSERAHPDRAGGTEQGDTFHGWKTLR